MIPQLPLFPEPVVERLPGNGPPDVRRRFALAFTEPVKLELLAVAAARPGEWLDCSTFRKPMERHQIGFCVGHVLGALVREGRLQEKNVYYGHGIDAERPGSPDYKGYTHHWMAADASIPHTEIA